MYPEVVLQISLSCKDPEKHGATFCWSALDELKILCLIRMSWLWLESSIEAMILIIELKHDFKELRKVIIEQILVMNFNFCGLKHNDSMKLEAPPHLRLVPTLCFCHSLYFLYLGFWT